MQKEYSVEIDRLEKLIKLNQVNHQCINLFGALYGLRYVTEFMVKYGGGSIVNTASNLGILDLSSLSPLAPQARHCRHDAEPG
jgi:NAD(P)-dependent dehydrogenase (short-subunit alcohol dehydrogenase family)